MLAVECSTLNVLPVVKHSKPEKRVRTKAEWSEDWDLEQDAGFGLGVGSVAEVEDVAIWAEAANDGGSWWGVNGVTQ